MIERQASVTTLTEPLGFRDGWRLAIVIATSVATVVPGDLVVTVGASEPPNAASDGTSPEVLGPGSDPEADASRGAWLKDSDQKKGQR